MVSLTLSNRFEGWLFWTNPNHAFQITFVLQRLQGGKGSPFDKGTLRSFDLSEHLNFLRRLRNLRSCLSNLKDPLYGANSPVWYSIKYGILMSAKGNNYIRLPRIPYFPYFKTLRMMLDFHGINLRMNWTQLLRPRSFET